MKKILMITVVTLLFCSCANNPYKKKDCYFKLNKGDSKEKVLDCLEEPLRILNRIDANGEFEQYMYGFGPYSNAFFRNNKLTYLQKTNTY